MKARFALIFIILLALALILFLKVSPILAEQPDPAEQIATDRQSILTLQEQQKQGVITPAQLEQGTQYYLDLAAKAAGRKVTLAEVLNWPLPVANKPQPLTPLQEAAGYITFFNILCVLAVIGGVACFVYLFGSYVGELIKLLKRVPYLLYELILYSLSLIVLVAGWVFVAPPAAQYVGFAGSLLFMAALIFTARLRKLNGLGFKIFTSLFLVWTGAALVYNSSLIGFIAVAALLPLLVLILGISPLTRWLGLSDNQALLTLGTLAALEVLLIFVCLRVSQASAGNLKIFENGALFFGSLVGYGGLLISSSKWYNERRHYLMLQIQAVFFGLAALFIGSVFYIGELQKIGGSFFVLYIIAKMIEIPVRNRRGAATLGLLICLLVFGFCLIVFNHQAEFQQFLFLPNSSS